MKMFKEILVSKRKEMNLTQKELADQLNVSDKTISKWENGGSYPDLPILARIAKIMQLDLNELVEGMDIKDNGKDYNYDKMTKYKIITIISLGFALLAFIFTISLNIRSFIFIILFSISIITSLVIYVGNNIAYRQFYKTKFPRELYDKVFFNFSSSIIHIYILIAYGYTVSKFIDNFYYDRSYMRANLFQQIIFIVIILVTIFNIIPLLLRKSNIKVNKDRRNRTYEILSVIALSIYILFVILGFFKYVFLPVFTAVYTSLLLISYIFYVLTFYRNEYENDII